MMWTYAEVKKWSRSASDGMVTYTQGKVNIRIAESAFVDPTAILADNITIRHNANIGRQTTLEAGVEIGVRATIGEWSRLCCGVKIGEDTTIGYFTEIGYDGVVGPKCNIGNSVMILERCRIQKRTDIYDSCCIDNEVRIGSDVFIAGSCILEAEAKIPSGTRINKLTYVFSGMRFPKAAKVYTVGEIDEVSVTVVVSGKRAWFSSYFGAHLTEDRLREKAKESYQVQKHLKKYIEAMKLAKSL